MPPKKSPAPAPIKVFEARSPKGHLLLRAKDDERVAYWTPEGWLLLDDAGNAVVDTRAKAEAFVAGALGSTAALLPKPKPLSFVLVLNPDATPPAKEKKP